MATPDDIENRLSAVEREVVQLRERTALSAADMAAARTLSAGADRDVSEVRAELRAHTSVLHALRETQLEHGARLDQHDVRFDRLDARFDSVDARFASVDQAFATVNAGVAQIVLLLEALTERGE